MILLVKLILAHLVGDFLLQPKSWVIKKKQKKLKSIQLYLHIILHGILVLLVLWSWSYWPLALMLMILHGLIDTIKLYAQKESNNPTWFLIDQVLHFITILGLWYWWTKPNIQLSGYLNNATVWIYATTLIFITIASGIIIQVLMAKWSENIGNGEEASLKNAGKYIGILERLFVFTFIVTGNWEAIGFLLAAKSIFRFGDLRESKDIKLTEYILIGTLLSFAIAVGMGLLVLALTNSQLITHN